MQPILRILLLLQLFSTLGMFGVIWFVQVVHYPLFLQIGPADFPAYEVAHANRTTYVVAPLMLVELVTTGLMLLPRLRPGPVSAGGAWAGAGLVCALWLSNALLQVPLHNRLHDGYSAEVIRQLVATNWIRTAAWSTRAALVLYWTYSGWSSLAKSM